MEIDDKESMQHQMELQLHEQYAINNNSGMSSLISILVGLFAAFGGYAYVFFNAETQGQLNRGADSVKTVFSTSDLVCAAIGLVFVLTIMFHICMYQGFFQRFEQFVIIAIRSKYYGKDLQSMFDENAKNGIFPKGYHPFGKRGLDAVQGLYKEFLYIIVLALILLLVSLLYKSVIINITLQTFVDILLGVGLSSFIYLVFMGCKDKRCCLFFIMAVAFYVIFLIFLNHRGAVELQTFKVIDTLYLTTAFCVVTECWHYSCLHRKYKQKEKQFSDIKEIIDGAKDCSKNQDISLIMHLKAMLLYRRP